MNVRTITAVCLLSVLSGCQTLDFSKVKDVASSPFAKKQPKVQESEFATPHKIVAVWSDAVYSQPGTGGVRGFGGRLYFYDQQNDPIPVEGQLVVYGYDDTVPDSQSKQPSRKFVFTPEQLTSHYTPSDLGASYSVWIPWDEIGGERKSISLLPVFRASSGQVVMAQQSVNVLPGKPPAEELVNRKGRFTPVPGTASAGSVQPVSFEQKLGAASTNSVPSRNSWRQDHRYQPDAVPQQQLRSTTITLPMSVTQRLLAEEAAAQLARAQAAAARQDAPQAEEAPSTGQSVGNSSPGQDAGGSDVKGTGPLTPPAARFLRSTPPAPASPDARPGFGHARTPRLPAIPRRVPPSQPTAGSSHSAG
jgi:hypothetical protein